MSDLIDFQMGEIGESKPTLNPFIDACAFTYINELIPKLFPIETVRGLAGIISFPGWITTDEVLLRFKEMGVEPMNTTELFTYCKNPEFTGWLMALGTFVEFGGTQRAVGVFRKGRELRTTLGWREQEWHDCYSFGYVTV